MQNSLTSAKTFVLSVVQTIVTLLILVSTLSPMAYAALPADQKTEIEQALRQQLPPFFELADWSHSPLQQGQQGPVSYEQLTLTISARLKEPLYLDTGRRQGGKIIIQANHKQGDVIELQGVAVVAAVMGVTQIKVMLSPIPPGKAGVPLSQYSSDTFIVRDASATAQKPLSLQKKTKTAGLTVDHQKKTATVSTGSTQPQNREPDVLEQLWREYGAEGEIWGRETYSAYQGSPVILRHLKQVNAQTLEGTLTRPYQDLNNPFVLTGTGKTLTLRIKATPLLARGLQPLCTA